MNLGQITREKREFMLKAGDLRQEVKKLKEAIEEQRTQFSGRLTELETMALEQYNLLKEHHTECVNTLKSTNASIKTFEERDHQYQEKAKRFADLIK